MIVLAFFTATSTHHKLRAHEREHLEAAVHFVRDRVLVTGAIPENAEFEQWAREMDAKGFRFEGNGFTLDKHCGSKVSEFCIHFSTGDGFATYHSSHQLMEKVSFDESPLPFAFGLFFAGLVAAIISKFLFAHRIAVGGA